jgi:hypothetical protein
VLAQHPSHAGANVGKIAIFSRQIHNTTSEAALRRGRGSSQACVQVRYLALSVEYSFRSPTALNQPMANVNVATAAFYKPRNLASAMVEFLNFSHGGRIDTFVSQLQVETNHLGYRGRKLIKRCGRAPNRQKFVCDEFCKEPISVTEYFKKRRRCSAFLGRLLSQLEPTEYNITLRFADRLFSMSARTGRGPSGSLQKSARSSPTNLSVANFPATTTPHWLR